jgi:hypothetical protein
MFAAALATVDFKRVRVAAGTERRRRTASGKAVSTTTSCPRNKKGYGIQPKPEIFQEESHHGSEELVHENKCALWWTSCRKERGV